MSTDAALTTSTPAVAETSTGPKVTAPRAVGETTPSHRRSRPPPLPEARSKPGRRARSANSVAAERPGCRCRRPRHRPLARDVPTFSWVAALSCSHTRPRPHARHPLSPLAPTTRAAGPRLGLAMRRPACGVSQHSAFPRRHVGTAASRSAAPSAARQAHARGLQGLSKASGAHRNSSSALTTSPLAALSVRPSPLLRQNEGRLGENLGLRRGGGQHRRALARRRRVARARVDDVVVAHPIDEVKRS